MPGKKRKRSHKKPYNKTWKGKADKQGMTVSLYRGPTIPHKKTMKATLLYHEVTSSNPGVGGIGVQRFRANGLTDPNSTGVGHQPRGFDQFMGFYYHYTVISATIRMIVENEDVNNSIIFGVTSKGDPSPTLTANDYMENSYTTFDVCPPKGSGANIKSITHTITPGRFLGYVHPMSEADLRGTDALVPVEQAYFETWVFCNDVVHDPDTINLRYVIEYVAIFTEPREVGES